MPAVRCRVSGFLAYLANLACLRLAFALSIFAKSDATYIHGTASVTSASWAPSLGLLEIEENLSLEVTVLITTLHASHPDHPADVWRAILGDDGNLRSIRKRLSRLGNIFLALKFPFR